MQFKSPFSGENIDKLTELIIKYIDVKSELIRIQVKEQVFQIISSLMLAVSLLIFAFLIIILLSIGMSHYLNRWIGSDFSGYFIIAGFYLLVFVVVFINRKKIVQKGVMNIITEDYFDQNNKKEDEAA